MKLFISMASLAASLTLLAPAFAQGTTCSTATSVAGVGTYLFDSTLGGNSNFGDGSNCVNAPFGFAHEYYFQWTATQAGDYRLQIPNVDGDMRLAVYEGLACQATCLERGDLYPDGINADLFGVTPGDTFLVQIANSFGLGSSGVGALSTLSIGRHPCDPGVVPDDVLEENDTCAMATPLAPGTYSSLWTHDADLDFYSITIPPFHEAEVFQQGAWIRVYSGDCASVTAVTNGWFARNESFTPKTYVLELFPVLDTVCADYSLTFLLEDLGCASGPTMDDAFEDNDDLASAAFLTSGTYSGLVVTQGDPDYYRVELLPQQTLPRDVVNSAAGLSVEIVNAAGVLLSTVTQDVVFNSNTVPMDVYFRIQTQAVLCAEYSLTIAPAFEPCLTGDLDIFDDQLLRRSEFTYLGNGFYPDLSLWGFDRYEVCMKPMSNTTVQLDLIGGSGVLDASLVCNEFSMGCIFGQVLDQELGQQVLLQASNPSASPRKAHVYVRFDSQGGPNSCVRYDMQIEGVGACGNSTGIETAEFCSPGAVNSSGESTRLVAYEVSNYSMLGGYQGPPGQFGFFVGATGFDPVGGPLGSGQLCLTGQFGRYSIPGGLFNSLGQFDSGGRFRAPFGGANPVNPWGYRIPATTPWGATIMTGDTLHFQLWHREPGGGSNLSNGLSVMF